LTTEAQQETLEPEVTETPQETQEVANDTSESQEQPPEGEVVDAEAVRKQEADANFKARQQKRREESERLKQENEYLRKLVQPTQQAQPVQQQAQQPVNNMPQLEDFNTEGEWLNAVLDAREQQRVVQQEAQTKSQTYAQKLKEYEKVNKEIYSYEDEAVRVIGGNSVIAQAIMDSDKAPQIVEAIALDPSKAEALNNSRDHYSLAKNILALENSVGDKPTFSDAPPPKGIPKGEPVVSSKVNTANMSKAEYFEYRRKQRNK